MNRPKVRQRYIELHGDDRHFVTMFEKRNKNFIDKMVSECGKSREEAQLMLDELDKLDEELDIDM
jgi:uncharacterized protein YdcH (DUF465 family)